MCAAASRSLPGHSSAITFIKLQSQAGAGRDQRGGQASSNWPDASSFVRSLAPRSELRPQTTGPVMRGPAAFCASMNFHLSLRHSGSSSPEWVLIDSTGTAVCAPGTGKVDVRADRPRWIVNRDQAGGGSRGRSSSREIGQGDCIRQATRAEALVTTGVAFVIRSVGAGTQVCSIRLRPTQPAVIPPSTPTI